jgi:toxin FitB
MFLLDTDVLSALRRPERDPNVQAWVRHQRSADLYISVITIGEIERGIARQRTSNLGFADALAAWLDRVVALYADRVLPFDLPTARRWGVLSAGLGNTTPDLMIAATALERGLTVVTGNFSHFAPTGVTVIDPFHRRAT